MKRNKEFDVSLVSDFNENKNKPNNFKKFAENEGWKEVVMKTPIKLNFPMPYVHPEQIPSTKITLEIKEETL